jgi:adenylosuccinate synthase
MPELKEFICDTTEEIIDRLEKGQAGLLEIAQGFQLSLMLPKMYPYCTSRNVTVAAGFDDMMLPINYAGNVILNCRTYPIRINSNKYLDADTGKHLIWEEVEEYRKNGKLKVYEGDSGPGYDDQEEITWETLTELSGSPEPIIEMTSVTKLPRRVFTFSQDNLRQAVRYNRTNRQTFISVNFANYVDIEMSGRRGEVCFPAVSGDNVTKKFDKWLSENVRPIAIETNARMRFVGTGPLTDDMIVMRDS